MTVESAVQTITEGVMSAFHFSSTPEERNFERLRAVAPFAHYALPSHKLPTLRQRLDELAAPGVAFMKAFSRPTKFDLMRKQVREKLKKMNDASTKSTATPPPLPLTVWVDFDDKTQKFFAQVGDRRYTGTRRRDLARLLKKNGLTAIYGDKPKDIK